MHKPKINKRKKRVSKKPKTWCIKLPRGFSTVDSPLMKVSENQLPFTPAPMWANIAITRQPDGSPRT